MKQVYLLLADGDGTLRSIDEPIGYAVKTEDEAKKFVEKGNIGYSRSYKKITICNDFETVMESLKLKG
jgi:hypothetical protein